MGAEKSTVESPTFESLKYFIFVEMFRATLKNTQNKNKLNTLLTLDDANPNKLVDCIAEKAKITRKN